MTASSAFVGMAEVMFRVGATRGESIRSEERGVFMLGPEISRGKAF
jgi:hypothetical protein